MNTGLDAVASAVRSAAARGPVPTTRGLDVGVRVCVHHGNDLLRFGHTFRDGQGFWTCEPPRSADVTWCLEADAALALLCDAKRPIELATMRLGTGEYGDTLVPPLNVCATGVLAQLVPRPGVTFQMQLDVTATPIGTLQVGMDVLDGVLREWALGPLPRADATVGMRLLPLQRFCSGELDVIDALSEGGFVQGGQDALLLVAGFFDLPDVHAALGAATSHASLAFAKYGEHLSSPGFLPSPSHIPA